MLERRKVGVMEKLRGDLNRMEEGQEERLGLLLMTWCKDVLG